MRDHSDWNKYTESMAKVCQSVGADLMLQGYIFTYNFHDRYCAENPAVAADCTANNLYFTAVINFYLPTYEAWKKQDAEELAGIVIHEFCHVITHPLSMALKNELAPAAVPFANTLNEQVTERIARIFMNLRGWMVFEEMFEEKV
jgi:hypothetical protein